MRLSEWFEKYVRGRGKGIGHEFAQRVRRKLSVPGMRGTPAIPLAPPRLITGKLYRSVKEIPTKNGVLVMVYAPYAVFLEYNKQHPHRFILPVLEEMGIKGRTLK